MSSVKLLNGAASIILNSWLAYRLTVCSIFNCHRSQFAWGEMESGDNQALRHTRAAHSLRGWERTMHVCTAFCPFFSLFHFISPTTHTSALAIVCLRFFIIRYLFYRSLHFQRMGTEGRGRPAFGTQRFIKIYNIKTLLVVFKKKTIIHYNINIIHLTTSLITFTAS